MSTAVEDAQPEQPVTAATTEDVNMDGKAEAPPPENGDPATSIDTQAADKKAYAEKKAKNGLRFDENGILKTSARLDPNKRNNSKFDPKALSPTDDPQVIRKQVEYYFSNTNFRRSNHMQELTGGSLNLPVKIEKICATFPRMVRFQFRSVVAALRDSKALSVTGPEGLEEVQRRVPFDPNLEDDTPFRSVYVKGFGDEEPTSQFDIEAFFAPYGSISVRLRRTEEKLFKGSVFVEFQDRETAEAFLKLEPKPKWKGEHDFLIMGKREYMEGKSQDIDDGKIEPGNSWNHRGRAKGRGSRGGRGDRGGNRRDDRDRGRDRGDRDPDDWKKRREDDRANGFKGDRYGRDNKGGRGRGRGRGRQDRGPRNDRNHEREDRKNGDDPEQKVESKSEATPEISRVESDKQGNGEVGAVAAEQAEVKSEAVETAKKRAREDDEEAGNAAKKIDSKPDVTGETS